MTRTLKHVIQVLGACVVLAWLPACGNPTDLFGLGAVGGGDGASHPENCGDNEDGSWDDCDPNENGCGEPEPNECPDGNGDCDPSDPGDDPNTPPDGNGDCDNTDPDPCPTDPPDDCDNGDPTDPNTPGDGGECPTDPPPPEDDCDDGDPEDPNTPPDDECDTTDPNDCEGDPSNTP